MLPAASWAEDHFLKQCLSLRLLSVRPKLLLSDTFTHWPKPEKRKGEGEEEELQLQLRQRKYSTAETRFCVKWETHWNVGGRRWVWVCAEPGGSRLAKDSGLAACFEPHTQNVRLSWWVIRLYKSSPQHISGPLFSLILRGSQETSSLAFSSMVR